MNEEPLSPDEIRAEAHRMLALASRMESEQEQAERAAKETRRSQAVDALDQLPEGSIIFWTKQFQGGGPTYTWAGVKAGGRWSITGNSTTNKWRSCSQLADFIDQQRKSGTFPLLGVKIVDSNSMGNRRLIDA